MNRYKIVAGSLGTTVVVAAGAIALTAGTATGSGPDPTNVGALQSGAPITLSSAAQAVLGSPTFGDIGPLTSNARRVTTPAGATGPWAVVPARDGACLVAGDDTATCGTAAQVNSGSVLSFNAASALPEKLTAAQLSALKKGGSGTLKVTSTPDFSGVDVAGLVPDGVSGVRFVGADGNVVGSSKVADNVYLAPKVNLSAATALKLDRTDGTTGSVALPGK